jgi:hypothetical protein
MEDAIATGAVDVIGMARPMTHTPDLPARLLDGSLAAAPPVRIRSRVRLIDDALQAAWFQVQLQRMGRGLEPDPRLSKWTALWRGLRTMAIGRRPPVIAGAALVPAIAASVPRATEVAA